jgi:poly(ADP-ribose) glycohydrolase ARH3
MFKSPPYGPRYYTDDTQMAIGVAEALLDDGEIVEATLCRRFVANYMPSRGYGRGARVVLGAMEDGKDYKAVAENHFPGGSFGNGAAMRVAPVGLFFHRDLDRVWEQARLSTLSTHVHPLGIEGAQLLATAVAFCLQTETWDRDSFFRQLLARCNSDQFRSKIELAAQLQNSSGLIHLGNGIEATESVVTAIACFALAPDDYCEVIGNAIYLGGDTDTIAAMAGALSGARLGIDAIPAHLVDLLEETPKGRTYLFDLARKLYAAATTGSEAHKEVLP